MMDDWVKELLEQETKDDKVLNEVKELVSEEFYTDLIDYMCNSYNHSFSITDEVGGEPQDEGLLFTPFVYQSCNGGYTGDDFAGEIFIPLGNNKFFKFHYSM